MNIDDIEDFSKVDLYKLIIMASESILEDMAIMELKNIKNITVNIKDKELLISKIMSKITKDNAKRYDTEPITYCTSCLSLFIKRLEKTNIYYCVGCSNTNLKEATINEWEAKYKLRYGKEHITRDK